LSATTLFGSERVALLAAAAEVNALFEAKRYGLVSPALKSPNLQELTPTVAADY
jgi:hypothetical protein